ncbi:MAG TPA: hypothetical protein VH741_00560 [Candidatus Limnocylindrales bacterium]|jgi:hypothetical protein
MKGMFLVSKDGPEALHDLFEFQPYSYGPFTPAIYRSAEKLRDSGLAAEEAIAGRSWRYVRPTAVGVQRAAQLAESTPPDELAAIDAAHEFVTTRGFVQLLRDLYARFPDFAVNTVVPEAAPKA